MRKILSFGLLALLLTHCAGPGPTVSERSNRYDPHVLNQVSDFIRTQDPKKGKAVVVFDLDDTLFDARSRTLPILRELSLENDFKATYPQAAARLSAATLNDMRYDVRNILKGLGLDDEALVKRVTDYWLAKFFSSRCENDEPLAGAADLVNQYAKLGATVVYLSGRDTPRMGTCSEKSLKKRGFPFGKKTRLVLKPDGKMDDLAFKRQAMETIEKLGQVIAVFENEPRNLNALGEHFPKAVLVFIDTQHSSAPDSPTAEAHWVKDFIPGPPPEAAPAVDESK
ncbi:haloacid dehalogenase-like hydrolase [bacterium]|nr:haloacid dehalogenase-like hydrolase [bacterium]